jgi:hypothetical protein
MAYSDFALKKVISEFKLWNSKNRIVVDKDKIKPQGFIPRGFFNKHKWDGFVMDLFVNYKNIQLMKILAKFGHYLSFKWLMINLFLNIHILSNL